MTWIYLNWINKPEGSAALKNNLTQDGLIRTMGATADANINSEKQRDQYHTLSNSFKS